MRVNVSITATVGDKSGMVTVVIGFTGGTHGTVHAMANNAVGALSNKYPTVLLPKLECTDNTHPLR